MTKPLLALTLTAVALLARPGEAQTLGSRIEVGGFGQFTRLDPDIKLDNVLGIGARGTITIYKWLGVEANLQAGPTRAQRSPFESTVYRPFHGLATVTVPLNEGRTTSLVLGAGGYVMSVFAGRVSPNQYEDGAAALAGLRLCTGKRWGIRVDGVADYNPSPNEQPANGTSTNLGLRAGMSYAMRGTCAGLEFFDWALTLAPPSAVVPRGTARQYALAAAESDGRPIELRQVRLLTCSSSDPAVATVDSTAKVTAAKYGTATVTCRGTVRKLERTATATVTVPPPEWTLTLTPASGTTDVGKSLTFTAKAVDAEGVDLGAITWSSANEALAKVSNGVVACVGAGNATISATKEAYGSTKTATATVTCLQPPVATVALDWTLFDFDRAVVTKAGLDTLQAVVEALRRVPTLRISVEGHADRYGSIAYNAKLSESRAQAVRRLILRLAGKDAKALESRLLTYSYSERCLITTAGKDEAEPPPPNRGRIATVDRKAQSENRRVEVWQLFDGQGPPAGCRTGEERNARIPFNALK
jgi:outer membrane protein OmpA-like peptidoglycan-associated protein